MNVRNNTLKKKEETLAHCLLPKIQKFFESSEEQKEFKEWEAQKAKKKKRAYDKSGGITHDPTALALALKIY